MTSGSPTLTTATSGLADTQTGAGANEAAEDRTDDLRAEMAAIAHAATDTEISRVRIKDLPSLWQMIENAVDALVAAGFRRVPEDAEAVIELAETLRRVDRDRQYDQLEEMYGPDAKGCGGAATPEPCGGCFDCACLRLASWLYSDDYCGLVKAQAGAVLADLRGVSVSGGGEQP